LLNFVKKTRSLTDITHIFQNYLGGYFIFDVIATVPELVMGESREYYGLKLFRLVHLYKLTEPLYIFLRVVLKNYSKKRQNDLIGFASLILIVIYVDHIMACIWLQLGFQEDCKVYNTATGKFTGDSAEDCI
jgi:hypothetical protein